MTYNEILAIAIKKGGGGGGGTTNYNELSNKPMINGHVLEGNMSTDDLEIESDELTLEQMNTLLGLI